MNFSKLNKTILLAIALAIGSQQIQAGFAQTVVDYAQDAFKVTKDFAVANPYFTGAVISSAVAAYIISLRNNIEDANKSETMATKLNRYLIPIAGIWTIWAAHEYAKNTKHQTIIWGYKIC